MGYYLQDNPNPNTAQYGWPRKKVSGVVGVHTAENNTDFEGADPGAEDVARFIGRRTDYGSYHAIADADSRIKLVPPSFSAWADTENNAHAMSVSGAMQAARWSELTAARAAAITRNMAYAAAELVQDAVAAGLLREPTPARRITAAEAIAGSKAGFYGHGETNPGRRYDPGQNFNWTLFLTTYDQAINGIASQGTITSEDEVSADMPMTSKDGIPVTLQDVLNSIDGKAEAAKTAVEKLPEFIVNVSGEFDILRADRAAKEAQIAALTDAVKALATAQDSAAVLATIEAGMDRFKDSYQLTLSRVATPEVSE